MKKCFLCKHGFGRDGSGKWHWAYSPTHKLAVRIAPCERSRHFADAVIEIMTRFIGKRRIASTAQKS
jgi:hypothetical protein